MNFKMIKKITFTITLIVFLSNQVRATEIYPDWFIFPASYPGLVTGYTYNGMSALTDAANMYCAFRECIVVGTLEVFENESSNDLLKNSNYFYHFSPDSVDSISERLIPVDRFDVSAYSQDQVYLYSLGKVQELSAPRIEAVTLPQPSWIQKSFFEDQYFYYGIGMYTAIGNENDGWKTAEEQAIFSVLTALSVEIHKIQVVSKFNEAGEQTELLDQISFIKLKFLLRDIQVMERYPDKKNKLYYVLVRIPKNGIISPLLN